MTGKTPTTQELKDLANMDGYGNAADVIRDKYDPHWGLDEGDLQSWEVIIAAEATVPVTGCILVEAETEEQAEAIALKMIRNREAQLEDLDFETADADISMIGATVTEIYPYD